MSGLVPLAFRSLRRNRRRSLFTLVAIAVGVGVVVFGQAFGQGLLNTLVQMTALSRTGAIQVHKAGYARSTDALPLVLDMPQRGELVEKIKAVAGVKAVAPVGSEPISVDIPADVTEVSLLGEKLSIVRGDGIPANYSAPGRPIAIISNAVVEYTPAPARGGPRR